MRLLLDSSGSELVCALADQRGVITERRELQRGTGARDIAAVVGYVLGELMPADLEAIVVGLGPGSFIGTRVAISFANGYAAAGGTRVYGVNSLAAIGAVHGTGRSLILRYARRGEYYYFDGRAGEDTGIADAGGLAALLVRGLVSHLVYEHVDGKGEPERLIELNRLATSAGATLALCSGVPAEGLRRMQSMSAAAPMAEPVYLRGFL